MVSSHWIERTLQLDAMWHRERWFKNNKKIIALTFSAFDELCVCSSLSMLRFSVKREKDVQLLYGIHLSMCVVFPYYMCVYYTIHVVTYAIVPNIVYMIHTLWYIACTLIHIVQAIALVHRCTKVHHPLCMFTLRTYCNIIRI